MAWTTPPTKAAGATISAAETNTYVRDNADFLAERPTFKENATPLSLGSGLSLDFDFSPGDSSDWDTNSTHSPSSDFFGLNTTQEGIWYVGATAKFDQDAAGERELRLYQSNSATNNARMAGVKHNTSTKKSRLTAATCYSFNSTDPDFIAEMSQTSGGTISGTGSAWGMFVGGTASITTQPFTDPIGLTDTQGVVAWWADNINDQYNRVYNRPAARVRRAAAYSVPTASWTVLPFDTEVYDTFGAVGADESKIVIPTNFEGFYYFHGCVRINNFNGTTDRLQLQFLVNSAGADLVSSTTETASGDGIVTIEGILKLADGDEVELRCFQDAGSSQALDTAVTSHMGCFMLSCTDASSAASGKRQYFTDGLPALTAGDFTAPDAPYLPRGMANLYSRDVLLHCWNPPVIGAFADSDETISNGAWATVGLGNQLYNAWGETLMPASTWLGSDGLTVPIDGMWLVTAEVRHSHESIGNQGDRGIRFRHNGRIESQFRTGPTTIAGAEWSKTISGLVSANAGDTLTLQSVQVTDDGDDIGVETASLTAAWVRRKPT